MKNLNNRHTKSALLQREAFLGLHSKQVAYLPPTMLKRLPRKVLFSAQKYKIKDGCHVYCLEKSRL